MKYKGFEISVEGNIIIAVKEGVRKERIMKIADLSEERISQIEKAKGISLDPEVKRQIIEQNSREKRIESYVSDMKKVIDRHVKRRKKYNMV